MKFIIKIIISSLSLFLAAYLIPGVSIYNYPTAILVAIVIYLLNIFIKPFLILLTIPVTVFTFGLFLFVINAIIIWMASGIIKGFEINNFWDAIWFSLILSLINYLLELPDKKEKERLRKSQHVKQDTIDIDYEELKGKEE